MFLAVTQMKVERLTSELAGSKDVATASSESAERARGEVQVGLHYYYTYCIIVICFL